MNENVGKSNKIQIILGFLVLIVIGISIGVGYLFSKSTPDKIYEAFLNQLSSQLISSWDSSLPNDFSYKENDISMVGNFSFDTTYDLGEFNSLKNYSFGFQLDTSVSKKIVKISAALKENSLELLLAKIFFQNNKGYVDIPDVFPNVLNLEDFDSDEDALQVLEEISFHKEDVTIIIEEVKNIFLSTFDKSYFSKNGKIQKNYNGKYLEDATEYIYLFDEANQRRTMEEMISEMENNENLLQAIFHCTGLKEDEIKDSFEKVKSDFQYESDIKIILTTNGLFHEIISFEIQSGGDSFSVVDFNDKEVLTYNDMVFTFTGDDKDIHVSFEYEGVPVFVNVLPTIESDTESGAEISVEFTYLGETFEISMDYIIDFDASVSLEDVEGAKMESEFTEEERSQIYENFIKKIQGTSLEKFLQDSFSNLI